MAYYWYLSCYGLDCYIAVYPMITIFNRLDAIFSLWWLLSGGIFYTFGAVIYVQKWSHFKDKYFGFYEIFHIFVILSSLCQYWFIIRYVLYI